MCVYTRRNILKAQNVDIEKTNFSEPFATHTHIHNTREFEH